MKAILLDFYGTVVHEDEVNIREITAAIHRAQRADATLDEIGQFWYRAFFNYCQRANDDAFVAQRTFAQSALQETLERFGAELDVTDLIAPQFRHWSEPPLFPDAERFLAAAESLRLPVCIVSNVDREDLLAAIQHNRLRFAHVISSEDARSYKPAAAIFRKALELVECAPHEVLHIGDSYAADVLGAVRLGIPVAWVNRRGVVVNDDISPSWNVPDLDALVPIVRDLAAP